MRGEMGRGVLTPLKPLGLTVKCYYVINPKLSLEYVVYFPKEYAEEVKMNIRSPFASDPVQRYLPTDPARRCFLTLSSRYGIKSSDYAGFYVYVGDFEHWVEPLKPPVLQGDSL